MCSCHTGTREERVVLVKGFVQPQKHAGAPSPKHSLKGSSTSFLWTREVRERAYIKSIIKISPTAALPIPLPPQKKPHQCLSVQLYIMTGLSCAQTCPCMLNEQSCRKNRFILQRSAAFTRCLTVIKIRTVCSNFKICILTLNHKRIFSHEQWRQTFQGADTETKSTIMKKSPNKSYCMEQLHVILVLKELVLITQTLF